MLSASAHVEEVRADGRRGGEDHCGVPARKIDPSRGRRVMGASALVVVAVPHRDEAVSDIAVLYRRIGGTCVGVFDIDVSRPLHGGRDGHRARKASGCGVGLELNRGVRGRTRGQSGDNDNRELLHGGVI